MCCISLKGTLSCCYDSEKEEINTQIKRTVFGKAVFRITYPVRQLIACITMIPFELTREVIRETQQALECRKITVVSVPCLFLAGIISLTFGLAFGVIAGAFRILPAAYWACTEDIDELDTTLEKYLMTPLPWQDIYIEDLETTQDNALETPPSADETSQ